MRLDMARAFSGRSGISAEDFVRIFYDPASPPLIGDFDSEYISDGAVLEEILADLSEATGLGIDRIKSHFSRTETFAQFGEHLLRAGAYCGEGG
jgi:hypothetical protein